MAAHARLSKLDKPDEPGDLDGKLAGYDYDLPEERIAQHPTAERGASRLLVMRRAGGGVELSHALFADVAGWLPPGALLVANNSRVARARLLGERPGGGKAELLLLTPPPLLERAAVPDPAASGWSAAEAEALLKPGKRVRVGDGLVFGPHIRAAVVSKGAFGRHGVRLAWRGSADQLGARLEEYGHLPLPPYIKREPGADDEDDLARYQTVYARPDKAGSVAAPTAGLHFTPETRARLAAAGFGWAELTLHVGYGTFSPVREDDIREHAMHAEYAEIPPATAAAVRAARLEGRPVIAVGTTSARTLEGAAQASGGEIPAGGWQGRTSIFIRPGYNFLAVDGLITNFHLPRSSLLMLVSALAGRENTLDAYALAVREKYRFFSYGDAMLIV